MKKHVQNLKMIEDSISQFQNKFSANVYNSGMYQIPTPKMVLESLDLMEYVHPLSNCFKINYTHLSIWKTQTNGNWNSKKCLVFYATLDENNDILKCESEIVDIYNLKLIPINENKKEGKKT